MYTSIAISQTINKIKEIVGPSFFFLEADPHYNPDMAFEDSFHKELVSVNLEDRNKPWMHIMFNREPILFDNPIQGRRFSMANKDYQQGNGDIFGVKWANCNLYLAFGSNSMLELERLEEYLLILLDGGKLSFEVEYPINYIDKASGQEVPLVAKIDIIEVMPTSLSKPSAPEQGPLAQLDYQIKLNYPVLIGRDKRPLILEINYANNLYYSINKITP